MTENNLRKEVLGFRKKDAYKAPLIQDRMQYCIPEDTLIPVVSIEWLEKEAQKLYDKKLKDSPMTWTRQAYRNALKDLLAEAKKKVKG